MAHKYVADVHGQSALKLSSAVGLAADSVLDTVLDSIASVANSALEDFRRRRNALATINRLPSEVLLLIMSFLPYDALDTATRVCHHWHEMLSSTPWLWNDVTIVFERPDGSWLSTLQTALTRSRGRIRKLKLRCTSASPDCVEMSSLIATTMVDLEHLYLDLDGCPLSYWEPVFNSPAPSLRTLCITAPAGPSSFLPDNLFLGIAPHLWSLWLTNVLIPTDPGESFNAIAELAIFDVAYMSALDAQRAFGACPHLTHLSITSQSFDVSTSTEDFTPPILRSFAVNGFVPGGIWEEIIRANTSKSELHICSPSETLSALVFARIKVPSEVHILTDSYHEHEATVMVTGDDGYTISVEQYRLNAALDLVIAGKDRLSAVERITTSDSILVPLLAAHVFDGLKRLKALNILFDAEASVPCPHMFCVEDQPLEGCSLEVVRLATWNQYCHGFDREYGIIELPGDLIGKWLPRSTEKLLLCGVRLSAPLDHIRCQAITEWNLEGVGADVGLDASWWATFPLSDALYV